VLTECLALGCAFLAAVSNVVIAPVAKEGRALRLLAIRSGLTTLFLLAPVLLLSPRSTLGVITLHGISLLLLVSGPAFGAGVVIYYRGIRSLGLAKVYPIISTYPLFSALLALVVLGEKPHLSVVAGTVVIVLGVWLIASRPDERDGGAPRRLVRTAHSWLAISFGAPMLFAISFGADKMALDAGVPPLVANLVRTFSVAALSVAASTLRRGGLDLGSWSGGSWARVALAVLVGDIIGHYAYFAAMQIGTVSTVVPLSATAPLFVVPLARLILKEPITWPMALGTSLTVGGLILVLIR